jgi:hypothetical protein
LAVEGFKMDVKEMGCKGVDLLQLAEGVIIGRLLLALYSDTSSFIKEDSRRNFTEYMNSVF